MRNALGLLVVVLALFAALPGPAGAVTTAPRETAASAGAMVNINTASTEELNAIPGIGPALARRIVEYRKAHGPFAKVDDLLAVKGIGPKMLAKIRDRLTVGTAKDTK